RHEHIEFRAGTIFRPCPKGGEERAFTVPVSKFVLNLLRQRIEENAAIFPDGDDGWVFPTRSRQGDVTHAVEARALRYGKDGKATGQLPSPHRLRDAFATASHEARIHPLDRKILMNHTLPKGGDVTDGYIRPGLGHLRE